MGNSSFGEPYSAAGRALVWLTIGGIDYAVFDSIVRPAVYPISLYDSELFTLELCTRELGT